MKLNRHLLIAITLLLVFLNVFSATKLFNLKTERTKRTQKFFLRTNQYNSLEKLFSNQDFLQNIDLELDDYAAITLDSENKFSLWKDLPNNQDTNKTVAELKLVRQRFSKGWDKMSLHTYKNSNAFIQSYLAGYLEGRVTAPEMHSFVTVKNRHNKGSKLIKKILSFFEEVNSNLIKKIKNINSIKDPEKQLRWSQRLLGYAQLKGLMSGYLYEAERKDFTKVTISELLLIQADGELPELKKAFKYIDQHKTFELSSKSYFKDAFDIEGSDPEQIWKELMKFGRCSAFVKLLKDKEGRAKDLLVGHTTWGESIEMLRIYKFHSMEFEDNEDLPKSELSFSAYPGTISSTDDYYITNNKLVVTETTIEVVDINLYKHVKPQDTYLPNYLRVQAATRFSRSAKEWVEHFKSINSGTYSSQWLILDYNVFEQVKGTKTVPKDLFYVLEQTPNRMVSHDLSKYLWKQQFFGSYNRAFFDESNKSLHSALIKHVYGPLLADYSASRRGKQFQNLQKQVNGLKSIMGIMRYNGFKMNQFKGDSSNDSPSSAISARYDIEGGGSSIFVGGNDAKVTNYELMKDLISIAVNGPTDGTYNKNIQPFKYNKKFKEDAKLLGLPMEISFPYLKIDPKTMGDCSVDDTYVFPDEEL